MYKRNGRWYSDFKEENADGRVDRYIKSWRKCSKTEALANEVELKKKIRSGEYDNERKDILFEEYTERYLEHSKVTKRFSSYQRDITSLKTLKAFFKDKHLSQITPWLIELYRQDRLKTVKKATVNRERACLSNMFTKAIDWELVNENPVKKVKAYQEELKDVQPLAPEDENKLLERWGSEKKSEHVSDIVLVALYGGMRIGEVLNLLEDNADFEKQIIHITVTKNWEERDIPMNEVLTMALKRAIERKPKDSKSPHVFVNPRTGKPYTSIKTSFKKAVEKIGIKEFRIHDLRHTWTSRMCENGVAEVAIQKAAGWKTKGMIARYAHPSMDYMREAFEKLVPSKVPTVSKEEALIKIDNFAKQR